MQGEKRLTAKENSNLMSYRLAMGMADEMLSKGIISESEHSKIELRMCEKYGIKIMSIYRIICRNTLDIHAGKS